MPVLMNDQGETDQGQDLAVYVHWPFCAAKCPYCDFNSHVQESVDHDRWTRALTQELEHYAERMGRRRVTSIFFGGGTPSLMRPEVVARVVEQVGKLWALAPDAEITLEANPTSADVDNFPALKEAGVNRLSLGMQALNDRDLKALGRWHSVADARRAFDAAVGVFPRVSFDLIYGRPGQTPAAWARELSEALGFAAGHLSLYQLTIEPGTAFFREQREGRLVLPEAEIGAHLLQQTWDLCASHGYQTYEVSNFARPGEECRHNMTYWGYREYVGVGPGAHGRINLNGSVHAAAQRRSPEGWLKDVEQSGHGTELLDALSPEECAAECLIMGLRTRYGVSAARFHELAGAGFQQGLDEDALKQFKDQGLLIEDSSSLRASPQGFMILDTLLAALIPNPVEN